jgi:DNA polymerase-3 subunit delta
MIIRHFRILIQVKDLLDQGMKRAIIASTIGEKPFVVGITMNQAQNFSFEKLKTIYRALLDMDTKLKTGGIKILATDEREFVLAVDKFIVDTCAR